MQKSAGDATNATAILVGRSERSTELLVTAMKQLPLSQQMLYNYFQLETAARNSVQTNALTISDELLEQLLL
jgi:precorrin-6B methylase 2